MPTYRRIIADLCAALVVLALFAFNFAHAAPLEGPQPTSVTMFGVSFCGSTMPADGKAVAHAPCHACRIGNAAALPPAPAAAAPVVFVQTPVAYVVAARPAGTHVERPGARPRGPPATV